MTKVFINGEFVNEEDAGFHTKIEATCLGTESMNIYGHMMGNCLPLKSILKDFKKC